MKLLKKAIRASLRHGGYDIAPYVPHDPEAYLRAPCVSGSFPPLHEWSAVGTKTNYHIHDGYYHRSDISYFDDTKYTDECQAEVYQFAHEICVREDLQAICDVGCGSGYKLVQYFGGFTTVGLDVPQTVAFLESRYPEHLWLESNFVTQPPFPVDLVIAADVVEHLLNPDVLMAYINDLKPRYIVLSTPDRNLLRLGTHNGPPANPCHVREWSFCEFQAYVKEHFAVLAHFISNRAAATQCLLCVPRS